MCTVTFTYADGKILDCEHIKSACYMSGSRIDVSESELPTHPFPLGKPIWLFTESGSFGVSHTDLRCVEVTAE